MIPPVVVIPIVLAFPAIFTPVPPLSVNAPVVVEYVDAVADVIVNGFALIVAPVSSSCVILKSSPAPIDKTAPSLFKYKLSPTYKSLPTPTPPATVNAPVDFDVDSVVVDTLTTPVDAIDIASFLPNEPIVPPFGNSIFADNVLDPVIASVPELKSVAGVVPNTNLSFASSHPINTLVSFPRLIIIPLSLIGVPDVPEDNPIKLSVIVIFVVLTVVVTPERIKLPPIVISLPTYKSFAMPTPPATVNAPVEDDVLSVVDDIITSFVAVTFPSLAILTLFSLFIFMFIPVLPSTVISPADVLKLDAAPAFNETAFTTFALRLLPLKSTAPLATTETPPALAASLIADDDVP